MRWYVATMDEIIYECDSKAKAFEYCWCACFDHRKHPTAKRIRSGYYEYTGPRRAADSGYSSQRVYVFGTREGMGENYAEHFRVWDDYDAEMKAWENAGRPVDFSWPK